MPQNAMRVWKRVLQRRLAWHFRGRKRNCYRLSLGPVKKSLRFSTTIRPIRRKNIYHLFINRIAAGCAQHGIQYSSFMRVLSESNIMLNKNMLAQLSVYEPRTFQSLCEFAKKRHSELLQQGIGTVLKPTPSGIITRDMIKKSV
ncbi:50S ribosomal protein l20-like [Plakobranchus ocellatus]|uniref:Large ribosomal subunit protein bL20m n=1 Tax=Plakobranchus ocellatus TaxID=259542 RepID=A0AAV4DPL9_9GAST|nr:50S ribosomal protein l20-like [Plakobranchus ocellatus]